MLAPKFSSLRNLLKKGYAAVRAAVQWKAFAGDTKPLPIRMKSSPLGILVKGCDGIIHTAAAAGHGVSADDPKGTRYLPIFRRCCQPVIQASLIYELQVFSELWKTLQTTGVSFSEILLGQSTSSDESYIHMRPWHYLLPQHHVRSGKREQDSWNKI